MRNPFQCALFGSSQYIDHPVNHIGAKYGKDSTNNKSQLLHIDEAINMQGEIGQ